MLHLGQCRYAKPFWDKVFKFITEVLGTPPPSQRPGAIILNRWTKDELGPTEACAFIRHAFQSFYTDFTRVEKEGLRFFPALAFERAILSFRSAVLRYGQSLKKFQVSRKFTSLKEAPPEARERFNTLIRIKLDPLSRDYTITLSEKFDEAIKAAEAKADRVRKEHQ